MVIISPLLLASGAFLLFASLLIKAFQRTFTGPLRGIPGPRLNRCTNLPLKFYVLRGERCHYIHCLHEKYGPTVRISPTEIAFADLPATREIHRIGAGYPKSKWYSEFTKEGSEPGIFSMTDVKDHGARRKLFSRAFTQTSLASWEDLLQSLTTLAVSRIKRDAESGSADILKWWTFMTSDIISEMGFGENLGALESGQKSQHIKDLETVTIVSGIESELAPLTNILYYIPLPSIQKLMRCNSRMTSYGSTAIQRSKVLAEKGETGGTVFNKMVEDNEAGIGLSDKLLAQEAGNFIIAGSDTTARTLTYVTWLILKHPQVKQRIQAEIDSLPAAFSTKNVMDLPYLMATIKETLRLYGAAPGSLPRIVPAGGRNLGGYLLPEGTTVSTQAWTLHRDANIYEMPLEFVPERWLEPTQSMKDAFMPWGGGTRICLGMHLAYMELALATVKFLRACPSATVLTKDEDMEAENYFIIAPKGHKCEIRL